MNTLIDFKKLRQFCKMEVSEFQKFADTSIPTLYGVGDLYFKDNNSNVLAVGHLDTVFPDPNDGYCLFSTNKRYVYSPRLDDRLGVYIILDILPKLGINVDVLLTSDEEQCQSTAQDYEFWENKKQYNWIVEFDRAGMDVVNYQYGSKKFNNLLSRYFPSIQAGTYTDICELEGLKVKAFNVGIAYYYQHSPACYADLSQTEKQLERFTRFFWDNKDKKLSHSIQYARTKNVKYTTSKLDKFGIENEKCSICGEYLVYTKEFDSGKCEYCLEWEKVNKRLNDEESS